jgi:hypothetical protein
MCDVFRRWNACLFSLVVLVLLGSQLSIAQVNSNVANVSLSATLLESLTVSASPSSVTFNLVAGGTATGSAPVSITTSWVLGATRTSVNLYGYFSSSTAALTDGASDNIPSSDVLGQVSTGSPTTYTAFTQTGPFGAAGGSLRLFAQSIGVLNLIGARTDSLGLEINLSTLQIPAGTYTGTLHIQAQAL